MDCGGFQKWLAELGVRSASSGFASTVTLMKALHRPGK